MPFELWSALQKVPTRFVVYSSPRPRPDAEVQWQAQSTGGVGALRHLEGQVAKEAEEAREVFHQVIKTATSSLTPPPSLTPRNSVGGVRGVIVTVIAGNKYCAERTHHTCRN